MQNTNPDTAAQDQPTFFIGTSGWTYNDWKGRFYPVDLPRVKWFTYYASQFNSVEVNATFYRFFKDETYHKWRENAPPGFGYVLKVPRLITHQKALLDAEEDIQSFYRSCTLLGDKFELVLLQVAPSMPVDTERLRKALLAFPDPGKVAVEFRHEEWLNPSTMDLLKSTGTTICNADSPQHKLPDFLTSDRAYLRLHGRKSWYAYNYSPDELSEIAGVARDLVRKGANRIYIYFNNDYNANAPTNARILQGMLNA